MMTRVFFLLLVLSPLLYSFDHDELREEKVLAVAAATMLFFVLLVRKRLLITNPREIVLVGLFSSLVIAQQFFIENGSFTFGIKYALVLLATFAPYWVALTLEARTRNLDRTVVIAIGVLFVTTVATIAMSYAFGLGEAHIQAGGLIRSFGWLGDSFTPVIVFFVLYYFFQKRYLFAGIALAALLMTGGKAAIIMLIASPAVFMFSAASLRTRIALAGFYLVLLITLVIFADPIFDEVTDLLQADYSYNTRLLSIYSGLDYFFSAPWTGTGINQSMRFVDVDSVMLAYWLGIESYFEVYQIHNAIIRTAAETGVPGLVLLLLLFYVLLDASFRALRAGQKIADPRERAIILAASLWVISFILFYQTTGWFEAGHPQLSWLLLFSTLSDVFYRRCARQGAAANPSVGR